MLLLSFFDEVRWKQQPWTQLSRKCPEWLNQVQVQSRNDAAVSSSPVIKQVKELFHQVSTSRIGLWAGSFNGLCLVLGSAWLSTCSGKVPPQASVDRVDAAVAYAQSRRWSALKCVKNCLCVAAVRPLSATSVFPAWSVTTAMPRRLLLIFKWSSRRADLNLSSVEASMRPWWTPACPLTCEIHGCGPQMAFQLWTVVGRRSSEASFSILWSGWSFELLWVVTCRMAYDVSRSVVDVVQQCLQVVVFVSFSSSAVLETGKLKCCLTSALKVICEASSILFGILLFNYFQQRLAGMQTMPGVGVFGCNDPPSAAQTNTVQFQQRIVIVCSVTVAGRHGAIFLWPYCEIQCIVTSLN